MRQGVAPTGPTAATREDPCSASGWASGRGNDSPRRTCPSRHQVFGEFESNDRLFALHGGAIIELLLQGHTGSRAIHGEARGHNSGHSPPPRS